MQRYDYDIAVSFASEDRSTTELYLQPLIDEGYEVFYDLWQADILLGKNLLKHLDFVYRRAARYCIIFVSAHYVRKTWTTFEFQTALKRAVKESYEYILPLRIDDTPLPDLHLEIAYLDLRSNSVEQVISILRNKLGRPLGRMPLSEDLNSADKQRRLSAMTRIWCEKDAAYLEEMKALLRSDRDSEIRARAAWVLDSLSDISAKDVLLAALGDKNRNVRSNAAWALVHLGSDVRDGVIGVLNQSKNEDAREIAALILQKVYSGKLNPMIWKQVASMYGAAGAGASAAAEAMVFAATMTKAVN